VQYIEAKKYFTKNIRYPFREELDIIICLQNFQEHSTLWMISRSRTSISYKFVGLILEFLILRRENSLRFWRPKCKFPETVF